MIIKLNGNKLSKNNNKINKKSKIIIIQKNNLLNKKILIKL